MKSRLVLASTWLVSNPNRLHAIMVGAFVLLGIFASALPQEAALACASAPGGSRC